MLKTFSQSNNMPHPFVLDADKKLNVENLLNKSPFVLDADDSYDVFVFRRLIEASLKLGFWNGFVGSS